MKYCIVIADGMADAPLDELDGKTPLEAAATPNLDRVSTQGRQGTLQTAPDGLGIDRLQPPGGSVQLFREVLRIPLDPLVAVAGVVVHDSRVQASNKTDEVVEAMP
jgi:hypothetical protein